MTGADECTSAHPVTNHRDYVADIKQLGLPPIPVKKNSKVPSNKWAEISIDNPADFTNHDGNIGIKLGEFDDPIDLLRSYIFALDIDVKNGDGCVELEALEALYGELPETWTATTPSGGRHLLFRSPVEIRNTQANGNRLAPNIDIRGKGGYIVTAPSTIDGEPYRWERSPWDTEIGDAPDWLIDLLTAEPEQPAPTPTPSPPSLNSDSPADRLRNVWNWQHELQRQGWVLHHSDGDDTYWTRPGKPTSEGHSAVLHGNGPLVIWTTDIPQPLQSLSQPTRDGSGVTITPFDWYAAHNHHGERKDAAAAIHEASRKAEMAETEIAWESVKATTPPTDDNYRNPWHDLLIDFSALGDRPEAIIDGLVFPGRWTFIYAEKKQGKSTLLVGLALAIAKGHDPIANQSTRPRKILYLDAEMGRLDLSERLDDFGQPPETIHTDVPNWKASDHIQSLANEQHANTFLAFVDELNPELVVLDGINGFIEGDENSNHEWVNLFRNIIQPLKKRNIAVISSDNSGKDPTKGARGGSAKGDKADAVILLKRLDGTGYRLERRYTRTNAYNETTEVIIENVKPDSTEPMRIRPATGRQWPRGTADAAEAMDSLNVPLDMPTRKVATLLRDNGHRYRGTTINAAIQYRKQQAHDLGDAL